MLNGIIQFALRYRMLIVFTALAVLIYGSYSATTLPIDVFPDLDRPRVVIMTEAPGLVHAASLLVLFTRDEDTARHDLVAWANRCLDKGLLIDRTALEAFAITDRIGNGVCCVAMTRVRVG